MTSKKINFKKKVQLKRDSGYLIFQKIDIFLQTNEKVPTFHKHVRAYSFACYHPM